MNKDVLERIKVIEIDCPECEYMIDDEQYYCSTCGCQGGAGKINVYKYITKNIVEIGKNSTVDYPWHVKGFRL